MKTTIVWTSQRLRTKAFFYKKKVSIYLCSVCEQESKVNIEINQCFSHITSSLMRKFYPRIISMDIKLQPLYYSSYIEVHVWRSYILKVVSQFPMCIKSPWKLIFCLSLNCNTRVRISTNNLNFSRAQIISATLFFDLWQI